MRKVSRIIACLILSIFLMTNAFAAENNQVPVTAIEDLMREHGILRRIFLIYENVLGRLDGKDRTAPEIAKKAAKIVQEFVENYHEKLEEDYIFPRFERSGKYKDLASTLRKQHILSRELTKRIISHPNADDIRRFVNIYRQHAAREDTVLFPAFHSMVSLSEYEKMGDLFEDKEEELFGKSGFEKKVEEIAKMEKDLNIYDLPTSINPQ